VTKDIIIIIIIIIIITIIIKRPGRESRHSPSSNAEVKNERSYIPTPRICLQGVDWDKFSLVFFVRFLGISFKFRIVRRAGITYLAASVGIFLLVSRAELSVMGRVKRWRLSNTSEKHISPCVRTCSFTVPELQVQRQRVILVVSGGR